VTLYTRSPKANSIGIDVFIVRDLRSLNAKKCKAPHPGESAGGVAPPADSPDIRKLQLPVKNPTHVSSGVEVRKQRIAIGLQVESRQVRMSIVTLGSAALRYMNERAASVR
jgi:hypothetical protein